MTVKSKALGVLVLVGFLTSFAEKTTRNINYSIFGQKYASVEIMDEKLKDQVFYLISGHGGPDPGAMTTLNGQDISEDEYAYDVSLRLARNLISHGARVYMITRDENDGIRDETILKLDKDETVWKDQTVELSQKARLKQRTEIINKLSKDFPNAKAQYAIEIHIDSRHEDQNVDVFFYHQDTHEKSVSLAENMLETLKTKYETFQTGRGYTGITKSRSLFTLKNTQVPTVYIELGNIANAKDQKRILNYNNRQAIANWLCLAAIQRK